MSQATEARNTQKRPCTWSLEEQPPIGAGESQSLSSWMRTDLASKVPCTAADLSPHTTRPEAGKEQRYPTTGVMVMEQVVQRIRTPPMCEYLGISHPRALQQSGARDPVSLGQGQTPEPLMPPCHCHVLPGRRRIGLVCHLSSVTFVVCHMPCHHLSVCAAIPPPWALGKRGGGIRKTRRFGRVGTGQTEHAESSVPNIRQGTSPILLACMLQLRHSKNGDWAGDCLAHGRLSFLMYILDFYDRSLQVASPAAPLWSAACLQNPGANSPGQQNPTFPKNKKATTAPMKQTLQVSARKCASDSATANRLSTRHATRRVPT